MDYIKTSVESFVFGLVAEGRQCCAGRDREEQKLPPGSQFGEQSGKLYRPFHSEQATFQPNKVDGQEIRGDHGSPNRWRMATPPGTSPALGPAPDRFSASTAATATATPKTPSRSTSPAPAPLQLPDPMRAREPSPMPASSASASQLPEALLSLHQQPSLEETLRKHVPGPPRAPAAASPSSTAPARTNVTSAVHPSAPSSGKPPPDWSWPSFCFQPARIEVWVLDDETNVAKWLTAQVKSRVVDSEGKDAYLAAEYNWDDEYYVQDFGPQHVRERGRQETVLQLLQRKQEMDSTKVFAKASRPDEAAKIRSEMDSTKVFAKPSDVVGARIRSEMDSTKVFAKTQDAEAKGRRSEMDSTKVFAKTQDAEAKGRRSEMDSTKVFAKKRN
eukprot:TRINITY_DN6926_c0_g1_i1.p1 TRINITY_DN6926_c0_g1~~TRINITY_DN6926_c0_g1_i1.p1  ORF type:complete len:396 (+),score=80.22 TRINITY_DN6926_c0_g1_i1:25-1188(+)